MIANASEDIGNLPLGAPCITHPIRRQQRKFQAARNFDQRMIARLLLAVEMTLQLGINILFAENIDESLRGSLCILGVSVVKVVRNWPFIGSRQANQSFRILSQFIKRHCALAWLCMLWHAQLHQSDQMTKILI